MYQKIALAANRDYGCVDLSYEDVENYLRYGDRTYIDFQEACIIDELLDRYLG